MSEEMRNNPSAIFFTGTFTDKRIEQLSRKYGIDKENVNEIATKEVRLFLERIRQTNREKKSIKHWIVTEKGHTNTRRIHIHGIFWNPINQERVQALEHPMFWKLLMMNVRTSLEDQSSTYLSDFDIFNESMQKIINYG